MASLWNLFVSRVCVLLKEHGVVTRPFENMEFASALKAKKAYEKWTDEEILSERAAWAAKREEGRALRLEEVVEEKRKLVEEKKQEEEKRKLVEESEEMAKQTALVRKWRMWSDGHEARCRKLNAELAKAEEEKRALLERAEKAEQMISNAEEEKKRKLVERAEKAERIKAERIKKQLELNERAKKIEEEEKKKLELVEEDNMRKELAIRALKAEFEEREKALKKEVEELKILLVSSKLSSLFADTIQMVGNEMAAGLKKRLSDCFDEGEDVIFSKSERTLSEGGRAKVIIKDGVFEGFLHIESNRCFRNVSAACVALIEQGTNKCAGSEHVFVNRGGLWQRIKSHKASWVSSTH
jgi:hypothetical protein